MARDNLKVVGGSVLIFGDPHFSDVYTGSHKDFQKQSYVLMKRFWDICNEYDDVTCVVFLGDIFGVREQRLRSREYLSDIMKFFQRLNAKVNANAKRLSGIKGVVACVKGNHDMSPAYVDFDFFIDQGLFSNPNSIDLVNAVTDELELRLHIVNWGDEEEDLDTVSSGSNIVLGHGEFSIPDMSVYLPGGQNTKTVQKMANLNEVDFIISGHIHTPSIEMEMGSCSDSSSIGLFYPGSPARVAERIDEVFYVALVCSEEGASLNIENMNLTPADDIFIPKEEEITGDELVSLDEEYEERSEKLRGILDEVLSHRVSSGDLSAQIEKVPHVSSEAKTLASNYIKKAENN